MTEEQLNEIQSRDESHMKHQDEGTAMQTVSGRPRIRARRENGQVMPTLPRSPEDIGIALGRIAAGDSLHTIGNDLGVSAQAVYAWLLDEVPEEYRDNQRRGMIARIVEATRQLEEAKTPIEIARARELCRFTRWDAERRLPNLFGQRQQITHDIGPDLGDMLREARKRVTQTIDAKANRLGVALPCESVDDPGQQVRSGARKE
jgi:hypothetical protein